jgi:hypothetical protein
MARSIRFVVMNGPPADYPTIFREALQRLDLAAEVESIEHFPSMALDRQKLRRVRDQLRRRHPEEEVYFCPGNFELFLREPDMSFQFSAYRSWFDPGCTTVIPHPWTPVWPRSSQELRWHSKPPLRIGFMGSAYRASRGARVAARLPRPARRWLLDGGFHRHPDLVAWLNELKVRTVLMPGFARFEALDAVRRASHALEGSSKVEITDTRASQDSYADHLQRMTYILCPRGYENYSFRVYEALRYGRVPVIFDTDMVLPDNIDWSAIALFVPGDRPEEAYQIILEDYERGLSADFVERQDRALAASRYFDSDGWLSETIKKVIDRFPRQREDR